VLRDSIKEAEAEKQAWGPVRAGLFDSSFERFEVVVRGFAELLRRTHVLTLSKLTIVRHRGGDPSNFLLRRRRRGFEVRLGPMSRFLEWNRLSM
jgi:hypothetical protein